MSLLSISELRERRAMMTPTELESLCKDAAAYAVRPPYSTSDRADCAADIYADIIGAVTRDTEIRPDQLSALVQFAPRRIDRGRAADVLRWIDSAERNAPRYAEAAMPRADDDRVMWTSVRNRAMNWRRTEDARRERDSLFADARPKSSPAADELPADYASAGAAQDRQAARRAASSMCLDLGMAPGTEAAPSPVWCLLYQTARGITGTEAAAELNVPSTAYRQRASVAAKLLRAAFSPADLAAAMLDEPQLAEAPHHWGKDIGEWFSEALSGRWTVSADVTRKLTAPDPDAPARRAAAEADRERRRAHSRRVIGALLADRGTNAGTGLQHDSTGRTSGKPEARYAAHAVRLGDR